LRALTGRNPTSLANAKNENQHQPIDCRRADGHGDAQLRSANISVLKNVFSGSDSSRQRVEAPFPATDKMQFFGWV
jgi:hypothetical protein